MCVATVRGALKQHPGVGEVAIQESDRQFKVAYDPELTDVDAILAVLKSAGESAKRK